MLLKIEVWENALSYWSIFKVLMNDAIFDKEFNFKGASDIEPMITYGTNPGMAIPISKVNSKRFRFRLRIIISKGTRLYGV